MDTFYKIHLIFFFRDENLNHDNFSLLFISKNNFEKIDTHTYIGHTDFIPREQWEK